MADDVDEFWMSRALELAARAGRHGEVPVGCVVVLDGNEVGAGFNAPISSCDPTAHAEVQALRDASKRVGNYRLSGATLYVTLEPCAMCVGAIVHSRIGRLVFGAREPKAGAVVSVREALQDSHLNWRVEAEGGVLEEQCGGIISQFFSSRRAETRRSKEEGTGTEKEQ